MYIAFGFKFQPDPLLVRMPYEIIVIRERAIKQRNEKIAIYSGALLLCLCFILNSWFQFIPWIEIGFSTIISTIGACTSVFLICYEVLKQEPWATLLYTCIHTVEFEDYINTIVEELSQQLDYETARVTLLTNARARKIYKFLDSAQQLKELSENIKEMPTDEAIKQIAWANAPNGFKMQILKYGK